MTRSKTAGVSILQILEGGSEVKAADQHTAVKRRGQDVSVAIAEATEALTSSEDASDSGVVIHERRTATEGQGNITREQSDLPRQYGSKKSEGTCAVTGQDLTEVHEHFGSLLVVQRKFNEVTLIWSLPTPRVEAHRMECTRAGCAGNSACLSGTMSLLVSR